MIDIFNLRRRRAQRRLAAYLLIRPEWVEAKAQALQSASETPYAVSGDVMAMKRQSCNAIARADLIPFGTLNLAAKERAS